MSQINEVVWDRAVIWTAIEGRPAAAVGPILIKDLDGCYFSSARNVNPKSIAKELTTWLKNRRVVSFMVDVGMADESLFIKHLKEFKGSSSITCSKS